MTYISKVLMVDGDLALLESNRRYFESLGYEVVCMQSAAGAQRIISSAALDCVVLEAHLPDQSGFELCARIRAQSYLPVVFLSADCSEQSRIEALSLGADDYVCKPCSLVELELRVRARIRAGRLARPSGLLEFGPLTIDGGRRMVRFGGQTAILSSREFEVLYLLASHPGQVFSYEQIFDLVWKAPVNMGIKSLQMTIVRTRQKLDALCPAHEYIQNIRRMGYLFAP